MELRIVVLTAALLAFDNSACKAEAINCPASIMVEETILQAPKGWTPQSEQRLRRLTNIRFFDGNPEGKAELAPEKEVKKRGKFYSTWTFDTETSRNLWVSCSYEKTAMTLVQPAGKAYKSCTAISDVTVTTEGMPSLQSMECK